MAKLQAALRAVESKTRTHSSDRTSLELEIERLRRDLARCEDDLAAVKEDLRMAEQRASDAVISGARSVRLLWCPLECLAKTDVLTFHA